MLAEFWPFEDHDHDPHPWLGLLLLDASKPKIPADFRDRFLALNVETNDDLRVLFRGLWSEVAGLIQGQRWLEPGGAPSPAVMERELRPLIVAFSREYRRLMERRFQDVAKLTLEREGAAVAAALSAAGIARIPGLARLGEGLTAAIEKQFSSELAARAVVSQLTRGTMGLPVAFSDAVWVLGQDTLSNVLSLARDAVLRGEDVVKFSKDLEAVMVPQPMTARIWDRMTAPDRLRERIARAPAGLRSRVGTASYNHLRVARTEMFRIQRAQHQLSVLALQSAVPFDLVQGMRWNLSGAHQRTDICDVWAEADDYGLGPGIYPPTGIPAGHPNDLCFTTTEMVSDAKIAEGFRSWGQRLPSFDVAITGISAALATGLVHGPAAAGAEVWGYETAAQRAATVAPIGEADVSFSS